MKNNGRFRRLTGENFKRALGPPFFAAVILAAFCMLFDMWGDLDYLRSPSAKDMSVWYYYFFSIVMFGSYSSDWFPMLAALPFAASYCEERRCGITPLTAARASANSYCISKVLVCAVTGGLSLGCGILLHTGLLSVWLPLLDSETYRSMQGLPFAAAIMSGSGIGYFLIGAYLAFLRGVLASSAALAVSAYFPNKYVAIASPFILHFIAVRVFNLLHIPNSARLDLILRGRAGTGNDGGTLLLATAVVAGLALLCGYLFTRRVKEDIYI
jgi:hypothetical protein